MNAPGIKNFKLGRNFKFFFKIEPIKYILCSHDLASERFVEVSCTLFLVLENNYKCSTNTTGHGSSLKSSKRLTLVSHSSMVSCTSYIRGTRSPGGLEEPPEMRGSGHRGKNFKFVKVL